MNANSLKSIPPTPSSAIEIAINALIKQGEYGVVSDLSRDHDISRSQVYQIREHARCALEEVVAQQQPFHGFAMQVSAADIKRTVIALRAAAPCSITTMTAGSISSC